MKEHVFHFTTYKDDIGSLHVLESCPYRQGNENGIYGLGSWKCQNCKHCIECDKDARTVKCGFRILDLSVTYYWYDEIESGRKTVEYREVSDYWKKRLMVCNTKCVREYKCPIFYCHQFKPVHYDAVRFHRGQGGKQTMMFECLRIIVCKGNELFGAIPDESMFNIYLGKRLQ